ncbi:MAG: amidohydrolase family protein [Planctomycetes bacterium]|nr:amidohydrolase family protein [Planctomycetota bacterium]
MKNPNMTLFRCGAWTIILILVFSAAAPGQAVKERAVAIKGAKIETIANGVIVGGTIVIRDGKIEAVGREVEVPDDARVVDGKGMTIMPGVIDPLSRVGGIVGGGSFTQVADEFYPYQAVFKSLLPYGITNLSITPTGLGQAAVIAIKPDRPKEQMIHKDGNLFLTVTNSTSSLKVIRDGLAQRPGGQRGPVQQAAQARTGRGQRRGQDQQQSQQQRQRGNQQGGQRGTSEEPSKADKLWAEVVKGERYLLVTVSNSATILYLNDILEEYPEVKVALSVSGSTVFETIDTLKKFKPLLVLSPRIDNQPNRQYRINAARIAHEAGLEVAFFGLRDGAGAAPAGARGGRGGQRGAAPARAGAAGNRDVPLFAIGYLVKAGLERETALKALTIGPAKVLGLSERLGTIEPKKDANLLMFNGDPLDPGSQLLRVMVEGKFVYEN